MKTKLLILVGASILVIVFGFIVLINSGMVNLFELLYGTPIRESYLELHFQDESILVLMTDKTNFSTFSQNFTTIPINNLVKAHDELPKVSKDDRIIAGTIVSENVKSGTYVTENDDREFWYTIDGNADEIITIELQNHEFNRIVFDSEKNKEWIIQINEIIYSLEQTANVTSSDTSVRYGFSETQNLVNPENCSGYELCISGKMNKVIDGDTVHIDIGNNTLFPTFFTLSFAPELDEHGGKEAKKFIEVLCPVGSDVLVDQDGLYPHDRSHGLTSGNIISEVYCNGVNLNEALVESEYGHIGIGYCKNSEFSDSDWARNNGC